MDTEAIWQEIGAYGNARWRGMSHEIDAADHLSEIKRLLKEAEDERAELLKENERLHDLAGGWMPIDSAPKDGTMFLCWVSAVRYEDCSQVDECWWRNGPEGDPELGYFDNACGQIGDSQAVTHWRPLPQPPEAA
jgi:Protein of unknown function (DUF551)